MNLNQITVSVLNVEESILFYEKLGLTLIVKSLPSYARFLCKNGQATFSLHQSKNRNKHNNTCIYFEVENLDECVLKLQAKGLSFQELPNDKPWLWRESRIKDPDGNQIILFYAGENRINPPWRIKE